MATLICEAGGGTKSGETWGKDQHVTAHQLRSGWEGELQVGICKKKVQ